MPRTVLLADDSVTAQNMGRRILTDAGYEVITVNNGSAALKKIHEVHPDLVVVDVYMPGYGGLEVCQRLKESGETMRIPVLLSVGKMEPFKADEAKRVRADAHIVKPFEASELLAALAKLEDRIVPPTDSRGRKPKKPSFWHDEDVPATPRSSESPDLPEEAVEGVEIPEEEYAAESTPKVGAFPLVHEATGELPVIADTATEATGVDESAPMVTATASMPSAGTATSADCQSQADGEPAQAAEPSAASVPTSNGRWIAENVALTAEEAALELEQEMRAAEAASVPTVMDSIQPSAQTSEDRGAAFAAAVGGSATTTTAVGKTEEPDPAIASQTVAAWENWQQIRDTVMNAHGEIAESIVQAAKAGVSADANSQPAPAHEFQESVPSDSAPQSSSSTDLEAGALASIIDSVLAELKPKLMEEIAKKLKK